MKKLLCMLMVLFLLNGVCATAESITTCAEHHYDPKSCGEIGYLHKSELICTDCGANNTGTQNCTKCNGTGSIKCKQCSGRGTQSGSSKCGVCFGKGYLISSHPEVKCSNCKGKGTVNSTSKCYSCSGRGYSSCEKTVTRTKCYNCGSQNLKCKACFNVYVKGVCPQCSPDAYQEFKYRSIMRSPDAHVGEFFKVCGTIGSITLLETGYYGKAYDISLRYTDAEAGVTYTYNVTYFAPLSAENLLVGDKVDMWGVFAHYTADNQPCFNIHFASLLE